MCSTMLQRDLKNASHRRASPRIALKSRTPTSQCCNYAEVKTNATTPKPRAEPKKTEFLPNLNLLKKADNPAHTQQIHHSSAPQNPNDEAPQDSKKSTDSKPSPPVAQQRKKPQRQLRKPPHPQNVHPCNPTTSLNLLPPKQTSRLPSPPKSLHINPLLSLPRLHPPNPPRSLPRLLTLRSRRPHRAPPPHNSPAPIPRRTRRRRPHRRAQTLGPRRVGAGPGWGSECCGSGCGRVGRTAGGGLEGCWVGELGIGKWWGGAGFIWELRERWPEP